MRFLLVLVAAALLLGGETWPHDMPSAPLVGFSFSPEESIWNGRDPVEDLSYLLETTQPDLVRLPIYWEDVEPTPAMLDYQGIDPLLRVIDDYNVTAPHPTRVVLTIGARNFLYPELHEPDWAGPREQPFLDVAQSTIAYRKYIDSTITRYRDSPLLYAWQVENEPLDEVGNVSTGADQITPQELAWEVGEVHLLDPNHQAVITTYDGLNVYIDWLEVNAPGLMSSYNGHPLQALSMADALGLDLYVDGPNVPYRHLTTTYLREVWKQEALHFWAAMASKQGKSVWLAEMQAQPWSDSTTFAPKDLIASAVDYRQENLQVVLMWGVETWLNNPAWLAAGAKSMAILRS
ncbi:MAG TPA: hypothetical protein VFR33_04615 [Candidatus Dormibacteraeota bacterium]|nr:hypothetical protein [Candidatus Dormibacteraeota bacterium]